MFSVNWVVWSISRCRLSSLYAKGSVSIPGTVSREFGKADGDEAVEHKLMSIMFWLLFIVFMFADCCCFDANGVYTFATIACKAYNLFVNVSTVYAGNAHSVYTEVELFGVTLFIALSNDGWQQSLLVLSTSKKSNIAVCRSHHRYSHSVILCTPVSFYQYQRRSVACSSYSCVILYCVCRL